MQEPGPLCASGQEKWGAHEAPPRLLVHGCVQSTERLGGKSPAAAWFGNQMVAKAAQTCTFLQETHLTVAHFFLRYSSHSMEELDSPGGEQPL